MTVGTVRPRAAVVAMGLIGVLLVGACAPSTPPPLDSFRDVALFDADLLDADTSGDGRFVVAELYDADSGDDLARSLVVRDTVDGSDTVLPEGGYYPVVSDDGRYVAYRRHDLGDLNGPTVKVWDRTTGGITSLPSLGAAFSGYLTPLDMSADGRFIGWTTNTSCKPFEGCISPGAFYSNAYLWDRVSGSTVALTTHGFPPDGAEIPFGDLVTDMAVSADGSSVAYGLTDNSTRPAAFHVVRYDTATSSTEVLASTDGPVLAVSISGDGSRVAYGSVSQPTHDSADFQVEVWSEEPLAADPVPDGRQAGSPHLSRDGERLYYSEGDVVFLSTATLESNRLHAVELGGDRSSSATVSAVHTIGETISGTVHELQFFEQPALGSDVVQAWQGFS